MHRGDRAEDLAENVVDVDGVGGQAAAQLAVEGAAPAGGGVVDGAAEPVGLGGGDRRAAGDALGASGGAASGRRGRSGTGRSGRRGGRRPPRRRRSRRPRRGCGRPASRRRRGSPPRARRSPGTGAARRACRCRRCRGRARAARSSRSDCGGDGEPPRDRGAAHGVDVAERRDLVHVGERLVGLDVRGADPGADDADPEPAHRFRAPSATPRMIRRWKARKTTKTGTSDRADMAKSSP